MQVINYEEIMALDDVDVKQAELFEDFEIDSKLAAKILSSRSPYPSSLNITQYL